MKWPGKVREDTKILRYSFLLIRKFSPNIVKVKMVSALLSSINPYFAAYMSGAIISKLLSKNSKDLVFLIVLFCGVTFIISTICNALDRNYAVKEAALRIDYTNYINQANNEIDFSKAESAEILEIREKIRQGDENGGYGLTSLPVRLSSLVSCMFSMVVAVVFCGYLTFHSKTVVDQSTLAKLATSPWLGVVFAVVIAIIVKTNIYGANQMGSVNSIFWCKTSRLFNFANYYREQYLKDNKAANDVRIYHLKDYIINDLDNHFAKPLMEDRRELKKGAAKYENILTIMNTAFSGLLYLYVGLKAHVGILGIGSVVQYYGAVDGLFMSFGMYTYHFVSLKKSLQHLVILKDYLNLDHSMHSGNRSIKELDLGNLTFEFCDVSFKYSGCEEYALKHIALTIQAGDHLAVVGENGSGKTTIIKLLCRLYDPSEGQIKLNGIDIREFDYEEYLALFAVVFQDYKLFAFPVGDIVAAGSECKEEKVWDALTMAGINRRVKEFPEQLATPLLKQFAENGIDISGGEGQKIAIARALYRDAKIVVLDEPTAALDPASEFEIYKNFNSMIGAKTALSISHRMSSCRICDRIVVFQKGEIVQRGSHEQLVKEDGLYAKLWNAQAKHYEACTIE